MGKFLKFIIGGLLILASFVFGIALLFGGTLSAMVNPGSTGAVVLWGIIDFVVFLTGVYLMRSA